MSSAQQNPAFMTKTTPLQGIHEHEEYDPTNDYEEDATSSPTGCACFHLFCWPNNRNKYRHLLQPNGADSQTHTDSWLVEKLKKVKEVTESLAGPKFKTFIRKIGGYIKKQKRKNNNNNNNNYRFQYDAHSYALNFDSGDDDNDLGLSRFPATPLLDDRRQAAAAGTGRSGLT